MGRRRHSYLETNTCNDKSRLMPGRPRRRLPSTGQANDLAGCYTAALFQGTFGSQIDGGYGADSASTVSTRRLAAFERTKESQSIQSHSKAMVSGMPVSRNSKASRGCSVAPPCLRRTLVPKSGCWIPLWDAKQTRQLVIGPSRAQVRIRLTHAVAAHLRKTLQSACDSDGFGKVSPSLPGSASLGE
jgi:hypothetical protein